MDLSGTSMASYALTMWSALFGAHPSSLCVTGTSLLLRVFNSVRAVTWLCMDNGRTRSSAKCATTRWSFVFYSYLSVGPRNGDRGTFPWPGEASQAPRRPVQTSHSHPDVWLEDGVNVEHVGRQLVKSVTSM